MANRFSHPSPVKQITSIKVADITRQLSFPDLYRALYISPMKRGDLQRVRETSTQTKLSAEQRFLNVEGAFSGNPAKLNGKNVLLVDDVITTGATMINCTKALLTSGASNVYCISVARVIVITSNWLLNGFQFAQNYFRGGNYGTEI